MGISHALRRRRVLTELQQLFARANGAAGDGDTEVYIKYISSIV